MLREYSSKERKVEDLLELKVCNALGFCGGLAFHFRKKQKCSQFLHSVETGISSSRGVRRVSLAQMQHQLFSLGYFTLGYNKFNGKLLSYHCCLTLNSRKENYNCEQLKQNNLSDTKAQIFDHKSLSLFMPYGESPTLPHLPRHTHTHTQPIPSSIF